MNRCVDTLSKVSLTINLIRNNMLNIIVISLIIFSFILTSFSKSHCAQEIVKNNSANQAASQNSKPITSKILPLAEIMSGEKPSLEDVLTVLGIQDIELSNNTGVVVHGPGYKASIEFDKVNDSLLLNEILIQLNKLDDIKFNDVTPAFGSVKPLAANNASLVLFQHKSPKTYRFASIHVHLSDHAGYSQSSVQTISIRREEPPVIM